MYFKLDISQLTSSWIIAGASQGKINWPLREHGQDHVTRVYFRPLKKGVVLPLTIVKKWVELPLNI